MNSGLESATLWAMQLGTAGVALILMFLLVAATAGFTAWCLFRIKHLIETDIKRTNSAKYFEQTFKP